jgi:hypothetical protein
VFVCVRVCVHVCVILIGQTWMTFAYQSLLDLHHYQLHCCHCHQFRYVHFSYNARNQLETARCYYMSVAAL